MNRDFSNVTNGILKYIDTWEKKLIDLPVDTITNKRNKQNRTIKQILGHLIDSAANNHQRMIRLQYNKKLEFPDYQQDNDLWIALQDYQNADWYATIQMWKYFNLHMIQVIKSIDQTKLDNTWQSFEDITISLHQMIDGYLGHIELHFNEIEEIINQ